MADADVNGLSVDFDTLEITPSEESVKFKSIEQLLIDVVLPRYIPPDCVTDKYERNIALVYRMQETIHSLAEWLPVKTVEMFDTFARVNHTMEPANIANELTNLQPGSTFAMFVRRQHMGFICHRPSVANESMETCSVESANESTNTTEKVIVATFHTRIPATQLYQNSVDLEVRLFFMGETLDFVSFFLSTKNGFLIQFVFFQANVKFREKCYHRITQRISVSLLSSVRIPTKRLP